MTTQARLARLLRLAGVDFHVLTTLMARGWSVLAGALTVLLIPQFLSATQQGYYYTFASLIGLQILFELGLGQVILQLVSHEMAHLKVAEDGNLEGDEARQDKLASLIQMLRRWYLVAALLFAVLAGSGGAYFLHSRGELPPSQWLGVWMVMVLSTATNLQYAPALAFMEGCGQIGQVARLRLVQSMAGYGGMWFALVGHLGLGAACFVPLASAALTAYWMRSAGEVYQSLRARTVHDARAFDWKRDLLPMQWRIALSALSGYFIFYLMTPLVFANRGAAEAGKFGIAMAVFNALATVGTSWVYARTPAMAMHVSRNEREALNTLFRSVMLRSLVFTCAAVSALLLIVLALRAVGVPQIFRISEPPILLCLGVVCVANCVIFSVAAYMRAHREEPMLPPSVVGGIATALIAYIGSRHSVLAMSVGYAVLTTCFLLPWSLAIFSRYYRRR